MASISAALSIDLSWINKATGRGVTLAALGVSGIHRSGLSTVPGAGWDQVQAVRAGFCGEMKDSDVGGNSAGLIKQRFDPKTMARLESLARLLKT